MAVPGVYEAFSVAEAQASGQVAKTGRAPSQSSSLQRAGKEFESMLLTQWLQEAETSFASIPGSDEDQDAGEEQMKNFGVQALGKAFSESGGLGIADMVTRALQQSAATAGSQTTQIAVTASDARAITSGKK